MSSHIMVFDSGIGGTTVLEHIKDLLPQAELSYFMDNAYLPYGKLSQETIVARLTSLLHYITAHQLKVDVLVIACNTASTLALAKIRELTSIPVVGVVPAIKPATLLTQTQRIGLLATPATISNCYTQQLIALYGEGLTVDLYSSVELVAIAEQFYFTGEFNQAKFAKEMQKLAIKPSTDVLVLGCTHFPILAKQIDNYYNGTIKLMGSGAAIAKRVVAVLAEKNGSEQLVSNIEAIHTKQKKPLHYYATASVLTNKLIVEHVKLIDLSLNA
ncbi:MULTISPECIES: glutamate racemase [unclassified Pseudoalteromonas]|uniref:glutamate racemase n=1 Tax=unclassified Pseudoalteromonas TaxID=194690 RepID=UPI0025B4FE23|nr:MULTISPECIES: glutamate racemase [unclassified Pseudoalteromonas]MDN3380826.1 glutamate racemase [Pseudoalteromonas sp. APC 3893]MDN3389212.1 glutamate racemase [Pseudoalteromonas sp. APC 4017]